MRYFQDPSIDTLFNFLSSNTSGYPPYNVYVEGDEKPEYVVEIAVSGFSNKELDVEFDKRTLVITGRKTPVSVEDPVSKKRYLHQGLAGRSFVRKFQVQGDLEIASVVLENGILTIRLNDKSETIKIPIQVSGQLEYDTSVKGG